MTANDLLRPHQFLVRFKHLTARCHYDPECDGPCDKGVKERKPGKNQQRSRHHGRKRNPYVAQIVNVRETDGGIVTAGFQKQLRHAPIRDSGRKSYDNGTTP
jgi:hypothetical protein